MNSVGYGVGVLERAPVAYTLRIKKYKVGNEVVPDLSTIIQAEPLSGQTGHLVNRVLEGQNTSSHERADNPCESTERSRMGAAQRRHPVRADHTEAMLQHLLLGLHGRQREDDASSTRGISHDMHSGCSGRYSQQ